MSALTRLARRIAFSASTHWRLSDDLIIFEATDGAEIRFEYDADLIEDFKQAFPRARWQSHNKRWFVPGSKAKKRLMAWRDRVVDHVAETKTALQITEQKARDEILAFNPLPKSPYVRADAREGIVINVPYYPDLSGLLRKLPESKWDPISLVWRFPYRSGEAIRSALPEIARLAAEAHDKADAENRAREVEREARLRAEIEAKAALDRQYASRHPRPLRQEYLVAKSPRLHFLEIEAIADHDEPVRRMFGMWRRAWVAQIMGIDGRGKWVRCFIAGMRDYARANSIGSRGVYIGYNLLEGPIYEVSEPISWKQTDRYFLRIEGGNRRRMSIEEASQCLEKAP